MKLDAADMNGLVNEELATHYEGLCSDSQNSCKSSCNPSTGEAEAGGCLGHPSKIGELRERSCLK